MNALVRVRKVDPQAKLPTFGTEEAACADVASIEDAVIEPGELQVVRIGIELELEPGWECQIRPRSGLAKNHQVSILNTPGTLDSDFRGELVILLYNHGTAPYTIKVGDRIAQLAIRPVPTVVFCEVSQLSSTVRGTKGFGSTGY
jgi:dUTP pyrophosphatase